MKNRETDIVRLKHILKAIDSIEKFSSGIDDIDEFYEDEKTQAAVVRQLEIIGEASIHISDKLKSKNDQIPWRQIRGYRNELIHEYFRTDVPKVWETINFELPGLKVEFSIILNNIK